MYVLSASIHTLISACCRLFSYIASCRNIYINADYYLHISIEFYCTNVQLQIFKRRCINQTMRRLQRNEIYMAKNKEKLYFAVIVKNAESWRSKVTENDDSNAPASACAQMSLTT
jgi:hypothetical protein